MAPIASAASMLLLPLDSPDATLERVGGKGANLATLARAGFPVPPGLLITTAAYRAFVEANRIEALILDLVRLTPLDDPVALETTSSTIRELFERGHIPESIAEPIRAAYRSLAADASETQLAVAVRSSATAEDLPGLSFAGQQETYLNVVGEQALLDAVRRCWGSLWTARAIGYRARNNIAPDSIALAVVVQQLIPAEVAGVLFTANPLTGRRDEVVIDASFGLGESVVAGQVDPDHYVVDLRCGQIITRKIGAKALAIVPRAGGGTAHVARHEARQALPDDQLLALARLGERVAAHFGTPQDLEWAWAGGALSLLQSRPITTLYPLPAVSTEPERDLRVYFSFNSVQGVPGPITPLGRDLLRLVLNGPVRLLGIRRSIHDLLLDAGERLYLDVTDLLRDPRLRRVYLKALANIDPAARQTLLRLIDKGRFPERPALSPSRMRALVATLLPYFGRMLAAWHAPEYRRARGLVQAERTLAQIRRRAEAATTLAELLDSIEEELSLLVERVFLPIMASAMGGLLGIAIVDRWLAAWLGRDLGAVLPLLRGLPGNVTTEMDLRLWGLAQEIRADPNARAALLAQPAEDVAAAYRRGELPATAQLGIARFLAQYGMRAVAEIDIGRPRWRDDPTPVIHTIGAYLRLEDPNLAPDRLFHRGAVEAERMAADYVAQMRAGPRGALRARLLGVAIDRMRRLAGMRETPKFYLIRTLDIYRQALLASGNYLAAQGVLERGEDVFFVSLEQLRQVARGQTADLRASVAAHRAAYAAEQARRQMPRLLLSSGEAFYEGLGEAGAPGLQGDGVSPGVVEGRVRVVRDPHGVRLEPGEILVCPATDPGWTPLFLTAGGLVMEMGGLVTHGSVVAREYGIPAVVGVHQATARLRTGQRVRVDGSLGRVTLLPEPAA